MFRHGKYREKKNDNDDEMRAKELWTKKKELKKERESKHHTY